MNGILVRTVGRVAALSLGIVWAGACLAVPLGRPSEKPILTITGHITNTNEEGSAVFDRVMLEKIGMVKVQTKTPWYDSAVTFEGVPLDKLMAEVGATGHTVHALALNDYTTDIPIEDFSKYHVILALKRNGDYMPVKDKGPLFVIYPYDSDPELKSQTYYSRSAWQVAKMTIE